MLKTKQLKQKNKNQVLDFGFSENQKPKKQKNRPNRPDPKPKTKILVLVFGFSENQKPKKQKNQTQQSKSNTKIWVFGFWFFRKPKAPKKTHAPFGFGLACWVCFFCSFLVLGLIFVGFCFLVWSLGSVSFC